MTKQIDMLVTAVVMALAVVFAGCGADYSEEDSLQIGITLRAAECPDYIGGINIGSLGSLAIQFYDASGKLVQIKEKNAVSFTKEQLSSNVEVTGIPPMTGARVVFSGFQEGNTSTPKWRGEVRDVTFEKGKETKIQTVLYPLEGNGCFPNPLIKPRFGHVAVTLPDGRVLITGGFTERSNTVWEATRDVELLDPETGTVDRIADMANPRALHHVTVLPDGRVIIAGGVRRMEVTSMSVSDYPDLPFTLSIPQNGIELYTVNYPKLNKRKASDTDQSSSVFLSNTEVMDFAMIYQSYVYLMSDPQTGSGTLFMIGGVREGAAQSKIYGADITVNGSEVTAAVNEYHSDKSETFVMPMAAPAGDKVLVLGGRKASATRFAHLINKEAFEEGPAEAPNLFFGSMAADGDYLFFSSALFLPSGGNGFSWEGKNYRYTVSESSFSSGTPYWGRMFHAVFVFPGGRLAGAHSGLEAKPDTSQASIPASDYFEYFDRGTLNFDLNPEEEGDQGVWGTVRIKRALHRIIVSGTMAFVTGGIDDLKGATPVSLIEIIPVTPSL